MSEFFRVESAEQIISFRLSEIVAIETPNWPKVPSPYWPEHHAAHIFVRGLPDPIALTSDQWAQLKDRLEPPKPKGAIRCT